ncbi:uncharacterized protein LOC119219425 [Pungitius pungitius]|uniref:uncharacterized protein LOC119219425 n=1 Tax=Pungitius pungitius TaxID=134920 RepID=UPI002E0F27FE
MACGAHLGILLICFVQAEHVCCLWATKAPRQNGNARVGFSQQSSVFGGSHPQNGLVQPSGHLGLARRRSSSSSLGTDAAVGSASSWRFPSSGLGEAAPRPAERVYASAWLVRGRSESNPDRPTASSQKPTGPKKMPKKPQTDISAAAGSLISESETPDSKVPRSGRRGTPPAGKHQSGRFGPNAIPARTKTSASGAARRVSSRRGPVASLPSYLSPLREERTRKAPSKASVSAGVLRASGRAVSPTGAHDIPQRFGGFAIRRLREPAHRKKVGVWRPRQAYVAPQRHSSSNRPTPVQRVHPNAIRMRLRAPPGL